MPMHIIYIALTLAFSLTGQSLLTLAVRRGTSEPSGGFIGFVVHDLPRVAISGRFMLGVLLCVLGLLFWLKVLASYDLSRALPVLGGMAYIAMFVVGRLFLKEQVGWVSFAGIACIILGIVLLQVRASA